MTISLPDNRTLTLLQGDITEQQVDAIVNAANSSLMGGGGVDGAIHRAGGPEISAECERIRMERHKPLPPGEAVVTKAGRLPARHVIHTVGPVWGGGNEGEAETLQSCYRQSIALADELQASSIAFPSISTGAYGYPVRGAAIVALNAVRAALERASARLVDVRFVLFDDRTLQAYEEAAVAIFGEK